MIRLTLAAALLPLTAGMARAAADPVAPITKFIAAFDKGDSKTAAAAMLPAGVTITDEVPPYLWQGADAFATWAHDLGTTAKAAGIANESVTLGDASRREITGTRAYVIVPATYRFTQSGTKMHETAQMTFVVESTGEGWKIAAFTWTGPHATPG